MASFSSQVQYKTGDSTSYTTQMPTWLSDGVRDVVDRSLAINPAYADQFATVESTITTGGTIINSPHIIRVFRNTATGRPVLAPAIGIGQVAQVTDSGSVYAATESHPSSYYYGGRLYMWPSPSSGGSIWYVAYGAVTDGSGTIANFPSALYELVVLFASMRATEYRIATLRSEMRTYIDTDEDSELAQLKAGEVAKAEALLGRLASEYAAGFERVKVVL